MYLKDLKDLRKDLAADFPTDPNETDKVQREKKVNVKTEANEVVLPAKKKRRTKAEIEADKAKANKASRSRKKS
jgi:hypothetical protein